MKFTELLENHFQDPYHRGPCDRPSCGASGEHGQCELQLEIAVSARGVIEEAWFDGMGCATCEGIASILMQHIENLSPTEAMEVSLQGLGCSKDALPPEDCRDLPIKLLAEALSEYETVGSDDEANFGGPSLREEC